MDYLTIILAIATILLWIDRITAIRYTSEDMQKVLNEKCIMEKELKKTKEKLNNYEKYVEQNLFTRFEENE